VRARGSEDTRALSCTVDLCSNSTESCPHINKIMYVFMVYMLLYFPYDKYNKNICQTQIS